MFSFYLKTISGAKRNSSGLLTVEFQGWEGLMFSPAQLETPRVPVGRPAYRSVGCIFILCSADFGNKI